LVSKDLVRGLPKLKFKEDELCDACARGKPIRSSFKPKKVNLWIAQQLRDLGHNFKGIPIHCDNTSAISIAKNPVQHSRTKHIDVRHHFLRDHVEKGDISMNFVQLILRLLIFSLNLCLKIDLMCLS